MTKVRFLGPACNLGIRGWVTANTLLFLTDAELATLAGDSRFVQVGPTDGDREIEIAFDLIGIPNVGTGLQSIKMPCLLDVQSVLATLEYPHPSVGLTVDINKNGVSILSTKLSIDANETTSATAAVPAVISTPILEEGDVISLDIDAAAPIDGSTVAGNLRVVLRGTSPDARIRITRNLADPQP